MTCSNHPQPVPVPPPGWTYQWEYAGYRNKDGTITSTPKGEKQGGGSTPPIQQLQPLPLAPVSGQTFAAGPMSFVQAAPAHTWVETSVSLAIQPYPVVANQTEEGALTPEQCMAYGVPLGSTWGSAQRVKEEKELSTQSRISAPSPVMYGGYPSPPSHFSFQTFLNDDPRTYPRVKSLTAICRRTSVVRHP